MGDEKLSKIECAGFMLKPDCNIVPLFEKIKATFEAHGIKVLLSKESATLCGIDGEVNFEQMCHSCDFLVSLGGDGTLLSLVRKSYGFDRPVLGINAGNLGFLADIRLDETDRFLQKLCSGEYRIDHRMMLGGQVEKSSGESRSFFAFNDVVITSSIPSRMCVINGYIDGEKFNVYRGDGLIVSTPTGSTAYNLSAGGPVVFPLTRAIIITPLLAHSLGNQRPLVVPADFKLSFDSQSDDAMITIDGQERITIGADDTVHIYRAPYDAKLIHRLERNYFSVLREKLHWGDKDW